jgi:hypothetical protein
VSVQVPQPLGENGPVRSKITVDQWLSSPEDLLVSDSQVEDVGWVDAIPGHEHGLLACPWEVLNNPAILQAVFGFQSLRKNANEKAVIETSALALQLLAYLLTLDRVPLNSCLDDFAQLDVNGSSILGNLRCER